MKNKKGYYVDSNNTCRYISKFKKNEGYHLGVIHLKKFDFNEVKQNLKMEIAEEDMQTLFLCYPITKENIEYFNTIAEEKIELDKFDYFLECHANK